MFKNTSSLYLYHVTNAPLHFLVLFRKPKLFVRSPCAQMGSLSIADVDFQLSWALQLVNIQTAKHFAQDRRKSMWRKI